MNSMRYKCTSNCKHGPIQTGAGAELEKLREAGLIRPGLVQ